MDDEGLHRRISCENHERAVVQAEYDGDHDESSHPFLGSSTRRFTVKRDGTMRYCQKCKYVTSFGVLE
ncbi:hypothetical protein BGZ65_011225, partial [Modicella reniformis]